MMSPEEGGVNGLMDSMRWCGFTGRRMGNCKEYVKVIDCSRNDYKGIDVILPTPKREGR